MPIVPPSTSPINDAPTPTVSDIRAPKIRRASVSRPSPSVPSQCSASGARRRPNRSMSLGLWIGSTLANTANASASAIQAMASQKRVPRRLRPGETLETLASVPMSRTAMANPRIEYGVEHVDGKIHQDETDSHEQDNTLQDYEVARIDGPNEQSPDSRQREDRLDDHRPANQPPDVDPGECHQGE